MQLVTNNYTHMGTKSSRLEVIRLIISSQEIANQDELVKELAKEMNPRIKIESLN